MNFHRGNFHKGDTFYQDLVSQRNNSSLFCCAILESGDRCEWLHRMPLLIFRLYDAIWDRFSDIQELLHLGNEKNALFNRLQQKHSLGIRR